MPHPWERRILVLPTTQGLRCLTDCEIRAGDIIHPMALAQLARNAARDGGRLLIEIVPDGLGWDDPLPSRKEGRRS
jgi:hypothetical protein